MGVNTRRIGSFVAALSVFATIGFGQATRDDAAEGLRRAVRFYLDHAAIEGGYQFSYTEDFAHARSEHAVGMTQASVQRDGTPVVGMALLEAWRATGEDLYLEGAIGAARALVRGQYCLGGWDYIIEFDRAKRADYPYRADGGCDGKRGDPDSYASRRYTILDDNTSQAAIRLLLRVDHALDFEDVAIHEATETALNWLLASQYANGAWPQRFDRPPEVDDEPMVPASYPKSWPREHPGADYRDFYTLNDNTLADVIDVLLEAARVYDDPRYREAAERGGDFLLRAQMPEPQPAWAQQYNHQMQPAWARLFEPPAIVSAESRSVLRILMTLYHETGHEKYLEPIPRALEYLRDSLLEPDADPPRRRRGNCPPPTPCLARFYELGTNRPLFVEKGTQVRVPGRRTFRDDGYKLTYSQEDTVVHYGFFVNGTWVAELQAEFDALQARGPKPSPRPTVLQGLSPWQRSGGEKPTPTGKEVEQILDAMEDRGVWLVNGTIGKPDRVVSVVAAEDMVVTIGDRTYTLREDETLNVFRGERPPLTRIARSADFAANVRALADYLAATKSGE